MARPWRGRCKPGAIAWAPPRGPGYRLWARRKRLFCNPHLDRDAPFQPMARPTTIWERASVRVIFVDTNKRELVGACKNPRRKDIPRATERVLSR